MNTQTNIPTHGNYPYNSVLPTIDFLEVFSMTFLYQNPRLTLKLRVELKDLTREVVTKRLENSLERDKILKAQNRKHTTKTKFNILLD